MFIKTLRKQKYLSQEQLAEISGLSLRTIQRIESGHRVGYASLRALAKTFELDVDTLEQELYSMDNIHKEYKDFPLWLRLYVGSGWFSASRQELQKVELFFIVMCLLMLSTWLSNVIWLWGTAHSPLLHINIGDLFGYSSIICLVGAYNVSTTIRVGDKYDIWSRLAATQSGKFFGLFSPKNKD
ncbi:helix-turn-helix domain-containing protein [Colwelliaceae bacterium 6471]